MYFGKEFSESNQLKGFIGMEYIENPIVKHNYVNVAPKSLYPVLKAIATIQARSLDLSENDVASISGYSFHTIIKGLYTNEGVLALFNGIRKINKEVLGEKCDELLKHGTCLFDLDLSLNLNQLVGIEQSVMVHGDLWGTNIIWKKVNNEYLVNKIIDYQFIHMENPAEDFVRLILSTLSGRDFNSQWESLLEKFYEYFLEALEHHRVPPYTLVQLKENDII